jgi:hypothetical protein
MRLLRFFFALAMRIAVVFALIAFIAFLLWGLLYLLLY